MGIDYVTVEETDGSDHSALALIESGKVDLVINVPVEFDELGRPDGYMICHASVDNGVPLVTDLQLARAVVKALRVRETSKLRSAAWNEFLRVKR